MIKGIAVISIVTICITLSAIAVSDGSQTSNQLKQNKDIAIQLVKDDGEPLQDVNISVFSQISNSRNTFHIKEINVGRTGQFFIPGHMMPFPSNTKIAIHSADDFYFHYVNFADLIINKGKANIRVPKKGIIAATIKDYPKQIRHPVVVHALRMSEDGTYESFRGIGIFLQHGYTFEVVGLPEGTYKVEIKKDYGSRRTYFTMAGIEVRNGEKTNIGEIELQGDIWPHIGFMLRGAANSLGNFLKSIYGWLRACISSY